MNTQHLFLRALRDEAQEDIVKLITKEVMILLFAKFSENLASDISAYLATTIAYAAYNASNTDDINKIVEEIANKVFDNFKKVLIAKKLLRITNDCLEIYDIADKKWITANRQNGYILNGRCSVKNNEDFETYGSDWAIFDESKVDLLI